MTEGEWRVDEEVVRGIGVLQPLDKPMISDEPKLEYDYHKYDWIGQGDKPALLLYQQLTDEQRQLLDDALMNAHMKGESCGYSD